MKLKEFIENDNIGVPTLSPLEVAKKHGVPVGIIINQLRMGIPVENEHTSDNALAREIALDHLGEFPDYYSRLKKMEHGK